MNIKLLIFGLLFSLLSCSQKSVESKIENQLLQCFYQSHQENGIDVVKIIDRLESLFINESVLKDGTGESYLQIIQNLGQGSQIGLGRISIKKAIDSIGYIPGSIFCRESAIILNVDSSILEGSKLNRLFKIQLSSALISPADMHNVAMDVLSILSAQDFENEFYRTAALIYLAKLSKLSALQEAKVNIQSELPEVRTINNGLNILVVRVTAKNEIYVNNILTKESELKSLVKDYLRDTSNMTVKEIPLIGNQQATKGVIYLQAEMGFEYKLYIACVNQLTATFRELKEELALKYFSTDWKDLTNDQTQAIKQILPQHIIEE